MKKRISFDTSYLVKLLKGNKKAVSVWEMVSKLEAEVVISPVVLFELRRLALKQEKTERKKYEVLETALLNLAEVVAFDTELALKAAAISHGTGLPARDAIIYTTAKESGCSEIYTADSDFKAVQGKKLKVIFI